MTWRVGIEKLVSSDAWRLHLIRYAMGGGVDAVVGLTFQHRREGELLPEEGAFLTDSVPNVTQFLQAMMDAAYEAGIRPSRGEDRSKDRHLEDMRAIAFSKLGVVRP